MFTALSKIQLLLCLSSENICKLGLNKIRVNENWQRVVVICVHV